MAKQKACKNCRALFSGASKCPKCGSESISESPKGKILLLNPEESEIGKKLNKKEKGEYAIKI